MRIFGAVLSIILLAAGTVAAQKPASLLFPNTVATFDAAYGSYFATGDLNGDGKADLAAVTTTPSALTIYLGKGDGTFQTKSTVPLSGVSGGIAIADFNGDGKPDILVLAGGDLLVFSGKGDGTFGTPIHTMVANPSSLAGLWIADFNHDGKPDVTTLSDSGGQIGSNVYLGKGDGTFGPPISNNINPQAVADFNRDGIPDLLGISGNNASAPAVFLGRGDGTFAGGQPLNARMNFDAVIAGDFNRDGKPDLVVSMKAAGNWMIGPPYRQMAALLGNGDGTFQAPLTFQGIGGPFLATDLN